ncbi:MAG: hypothetical protein FWG79_03470 [Bacteroidales bacterium]|nr:hypothetical protein [Bacteroidales bacterium]
MKVLTTPEVRQYIKELSYILYKKDYFSYLEYAEKYVEELFVDIKTNLPTRLHKPAPERYAKYGDDLHYASFVKNKRTTWYAFFTKYRDENGEINYLVQYIANNHTIAQHL